MATFSFDEIQLSLVLIGNFNPRIFHPQWFSDNELISNSDRRDILENHDVLTHKQVAQFSANWFKFEVTETKLILTTTQEAYFEVLLDLIGSTFTILHHTPISFLGINLIVKIGQHMNKKEIKDFNNRYFNPVCYINIDKNVKQTQVKLKFERSDLKIGKECNFELKKSLKNSYTIAVNQHFEFNNSSNGDEFVATINNNSRISIKANRSIINQILENKN